MATAMQKILCRYESLGKAWDTEMMRHPEVEITRDWDTDQFGWRHYYWLCEFWGQTLEFLLAESALADEVLVEGDGTLCMDDLPRWLSDSHYGYEFELSAKILEIERGYESGYARLRIRVESA